jgi:hypothetical protein
MAKICWGMSDIDDLWGHKPLPHLAGFHDLMASHGNFLPDDGQANHRPRSFVFKLPDDYIPPASGGGAKWWSEYADGDEQPKPKQKKDKKDQRPKPKEQKEQSDSPSPPSSKSKSSSASSAVASSRPERSDFTTSQGGDSGYHRDLFGCLDDLEVFWLVLCCGATFIPSACNFAHSRGERCTPYHCILPSHPVWTRSNIRKLRGDTETHYHEDLCIYCLCCPCATCQDARELKDLGHGDILWRVSPPPDRSHESE